MKKIIFWALLIFIPFFIGEVSFRLARIKNLHLRLDARNTLYRFDSELGWSPKKNISENFNGSRVIHVKHNSLGFRDREIQPKTKPRILFVGDSYVWGYDAYQGERFIDLLEKDFTDHEINNIGVTGYGSDQEFILLKKYYKIFNPDLVVLIYCTDNDWKNNSSNKSSSYYWKPYFEIDGESLKLKGQPVTKSMNYYYAEYKPLFSSFLFRGFFRLILDLVQPKIVKLSTNNPTFAILREMRKFSESNNSKFLVGLQISKKEFVKFFKNENISYVDLTTEYRYPSRGRHWTPLGHEVVAERFKEFFNKNKAYLSYRKPE